MAEKIEKMEEESSEEIESQQKLTSLFELMAFIAKIKEKIEFLEKEEMDTNLFEEYNELRISFQETKFYWFKIKKRIAMRVEKKLTLWDVETIWQDGSAKTVINTKPKFNDDDIDLPDDVRDKKMKDFAKENRKKLKEFGVLKYYDDSEEYLQENPHLVCENTANCLVAWCINLEIKEKHLWMEHVAHQCICMQFILELSKQLNNDPKACINSFFTRIQAVDDFEYKKSFDDELKIFKVRIKKLSAEKVADTFKEIEEETKLAGLGQDNLNFICLLFGPLSEDEDYWETDHVEDGAFNKANDTGLQDHEEFKECIDSANKVDSISLDLAGIFMANNNLSYKQCIYLTNLLKDSNIENLGLSGLSLQDDKLTAISDVLRHNKIKNLDLGFNKFGMNGLSALSSALQESKIEVLNLSGNNLIENEIHILANSLAITNVTSLNLCHIHIKFCNFEHLSNALPKTKITNLSLENCQLCNSSIKSLSTALTNSKIQSLNLADNEMTFDSFKSLADVLENTAITELNISGTEVGSTGAIYLAERLHKSILENLNIGDNLIESEGCAAIGNVIHLTKIIKLDLKRNSIGSSGIKSLAENLKKSNVKHLDLDDNNLQINGARILADGMKDSDLEYLNVNYNQLRNIGMGLILDALQFTKITDFDLDCESNEMKAKNIKWVTNTFQFLKLKKLTLEFPEDTDIVRLFFTELKTLIESNGIDEILPIKNKMDFLICHNFLTDTDNKKYILDVFKHFHMKKLSFIGNFINSETPVSSIVKVLTDIKNPISNITTLDLSFNNIGNYGAAVLAENFKYSKLTRLQLSGNEIKNYGVIAIAKELKNSQIRYLGLMNNEFDSIAASYLTNIVEKHPVRIELFGYDQNGFSAEEQIVIKNINYMFLKAQLLVESISENSPVKYDKHLIEHLKAYEIFKNVDLLWESRYGKDYYDYNQVNSQIRSKVTKNFLKIIGVVNSDTIYSSLLPTEIIIMICSFLRINDIKFN